MTDSGAKANRSEVMRALTLGLYLFPGRCAQTVGQTSRRRCSALRRGSLPRELPGLRNSAENRLAQSGIYRNRSSSTVFLRNHLHVVESACKYARQH